MESNCKMIEERWIGKSLEENSCDLTSHLPGEAEKIHERPQSEETSFETNTSTKKSKPKPFSAFCAHKWAIAEPIMRKTWDSLT
jgi:hypothetical protein